MRFFSSLRLRLVALVLLALLPAMGLAVYNAARDVNDERAHAQERALQGLHLAIAEHQSLIANTHHLLAALAGLPELRPDRGEKCSALLARLLPLHASYANFGVADRNGEVFCSAVPMGMSINVADRAWFQRALAQRDFAAGDYQIGRITGKAVIVFGQPVWEQDQIVAVAFAALDLAWLEGLAQGISLPEGSLYTVMDRQGVILARWPGGSEWVGRMAPEDSILASILSARTEGTAEATDLDGLRRLYVYAPLWSDDQIVAYLAIGFPSAQTSSAAEANLRFNLLILGIVALLGMLVAWIGGELSLMRPVRGLLAATQRLVRGDLSARSGVRSGSGELNQLGRTFDQMAEALESEMRRLRHSEERLAEAQALAHLGSWELDLVNDVLYWSDEVFHIFEIDPQQFGASYQAFLERVHPEDRAKVDQVYRESVEKRIPYAVEHRLLFPDGRVKYVLERGNTFYDEEGRPLRSIGTVQDITERVEQEARYRQLFEGVPVGLYRSTPEGRFLDVNHAMVELLGYPSREALLTAHAADLYLEVEERERWKAIMAREGVVENYEVRLRRYDGTPIWVRDTARVVRDRQGNVLYYEGSLEDITKRVEAEQESRLLLPLTRAIAEAESFDAALAIALQMICETTGWDFGEVWMPSAGDSHLELRAYYCGDEALESFRESNRGFTFAPGEGLPGRVWASGKPAWIPDVTQDANFPRAPYAREAGLRAAVGIPILDNGAVVAVMNFFLREAQREDEQMVALLSSVAAQLGTAFRRRQAEDALHANRDYLNALLDTIGDAIFTVTIPERRIEYVNQAVNEIFGYSPEEILGQTTRLFYPDEAGFAAYGRRLQEALARGEHSVRSELELRHKNGVRLWCEIHTTFLLTNGQPRRVISVLRDVTERKRAQEQLRLQATALENAADAVIITDREGIILWANPAFTALSGYSLEEALGQNMRLIKSGLYDQEYYRKLWETILSGQVWHSEIVNRRKDGSFYEVEQMITPVRDAQGEITHFVATQRDITERRRHEREVEAEALVAKALRENLELQPLLERLLAAAIHAIPGAEKGSILLVEADGRLRIRALQGYRDPRVRETTFPSNSGYAARCVRLRQPLLLEDVRADPEIRYDGEIEEMAAMQSAIVAPLQVGERVIGTIALDNATRKSAFDEHALHTLNTIASTAALVIENARLFEETRHRLERIEALRAIDMAITSSFDPRVSLNVLLDQVTSRMGVDAAAVLLYDPYLHELTFVAGRGFRSNAIERSRLRFGEGHAGRAAQERRLVSVPDLEKNLEQFVRADLLRNEGFRAYYAAPMIAKGRVVGVLEVFHRSRLPAREDEMSQYEWEIFLETLAGQAAIAVDNATLFQDLQYSNLQLQLAYDATIEGWSRALDMRDRETEGHTQRVTELTLRLAREMGLSDDDLVHIRRGCLLHDIGKMGIPDNILLKPGPLTEEEWEIMRRHPQLAFDMLASIEYLRPALDIPFCHHEKWDGSGYPRGLKGEQIPLAARIFAVVDVWDALTSNRPYRKAWSKKRALAYIKKQAGTHFDPRVVEVFLRAMNP